jgi:hypothetical protein
MKNLKIGRIGTAVIIAVVTGSLFATSAFARRDDHRRGGEWRGHRGGGFVAAGYPYGYAQPVYVPPPVYYPPQPSPGISLFVPLNLRIR